MDAVNSLFLLDDSSLVRKCQSGDGLAFGTLVERHYALVHGCSYRRVGNRADAEDIVQEVMVKLGSAIKSLREPAALRGFLLRLTINAVTDHFRKKTRETKGLASYFVDPTTMQPCESEDHNSALWVAVRRLPDKQRDAVLLVYGDGATHREAAEALSCAEATISFHVHEARKRLKEMLKEDAQ